MIVNEFESSKKYRLQQIMHTLESVHGIKLDFDSSTVAEIKTFVESCEIIKNSIVKESAFNTTVQNPEYTKNMLIIEAAKIYLAEIAPRRMNKKKSVKESTLEEMPSTRSIGQGATRAWANDKTSADRAKNPIRRTFKQPGELSKEEARQQLKQLMQQYLGSGGNIKKVSEEDALVKERELEEMPSTRSIGQGAARAWANDKTSADRAKNPISRSFRQPGELSKDDNRMLAKDAIAQFTASGKKIKKVSEEEGLKLQPGTLKVTKPGSNQEEVINANELANKQRQGFQPVAEEDLPYDPRIDVHDPNSEEYAAILRARQEEDPGLKKLRSRNPDLDNLMKDYGIEEATDQDGDGDNDFADVMVARMTRSGMPKGAAIGKTHNKPYNKESMMEAKKKGAKPDFLDVDKDGDKKEPMKKAIKDKKNKALKEAAHMETHDDYQADMARSELYRNTKYAMDMMKMIGPDDEVKPWISANLTKSAEILDKVYHYMDYYLTFEQPGQDAVMPVEEEADMIPGDAGSIARQNLLMIMEYSTKLFRMIKPGDKLEGWVAMKLTSASEAISSSKHHMDYVQFQKHAGDMMPDEMTMDAEPMAQIEDKSNLKEATVANLIMNAMLNEEQDLAQAETLLAAKAMSDELQGIAEKLAKMSVDDLMPLVDIMKEQFGQDAANGFNDTVKGALQSVLDAATQAKDTTDNAVLTMQQGGTPGVASDIENTDLGGIGDMPAGDEDDDEMDDELGATPAAAGEPDEPLGRSKKSDKGPPEEIEESWGTKMKTAKKDEGKWDGYTVAELKAKKKKLMDKESRTAAEQKEVKQINFAIRAKSGWGKVDESKVAEGNKENKEKSRAAKAGMDPKEKSRQKAKDAMSKFDPRVDLKPGKKVAEGKGKKVTALMTSKKVNESQVNEYAPPGKKAEEFIKQNKESFKNRYGKNWQKVLYATAWKKFGTKKESYIKAEQMLETANQKQKQLKKAFEGHKKSFAVQLKEGAVVDPLKVGYGLEGQTLLDQLSETTDLISKLKAMIQSEVNAGVKNLIVAEQNNTLAAKLSESKARAPYGVVWKDAAGKAKEKFFETADLRKYWMDLNTSALTEHKLVNPGDFDKRIRNLKVGK